MLFCLLSLSIVFGGTLVRGNDVWMVISVAENGLWTNPSVEPWSLSFALQDLTCCEFYSGVASIVAGFRSWVAGACRLTYIYIYRCTFFHGGQNRYTVWFWMKSKLKIWSIYTLNTWCDISHPKFESGIPNSLFISSFRYIWMWCHCVS